MITGRRATSARPALAPGTVVVGADGSRHADRAVAWAVEQASLEHRPLTVVTAATRSAPRINAEAVRRARELAPDVEVVGTIARADPRIALAELSQHAHLVVVGSRGRSHLGTLLLGSVSGTVTRWALCPAVVCRSSEEPHGGRGVLVAVDGPGEAAPVVGFGFAQAELRGQALTVVHCVGDVDESEARSRLAEAVAGLTATHPEVPVQSLVVHGPAEDALGEQASAWDLVVVGRYPADDPDDPDGAESTPGSMAMTVLEHARTNVAVVPTTRVPRLSPA